MAAKKASTAYDKVSPSYPERDYQCDEDVRTLQRSAEVMADAPRRKKALSKFRQQQSGGQRLIDVLSGHRMSQKKR